MEVSDLIVEVGNQQPTSHRKPALPGQRPESGGGHDHAVEHDVSGADNRHLGAAVRHRRQPDLVISHVAPLELESNQPGGRAMYGTPASALPRHGSGRFRTAKSTTAWP